MGKKNKTLKVQSVKPTISKTSSSRVTNKCEQLLSLSFAHITTNKKYCFSYCDKLGQKEKCDILRGICTRLEELSQKEWKHWIALSKFKGCETIEYQQLQILPSNLNLTPDEKVFVFRFKYCGSDGRILGVKKGACAVLHIIGFDFDFSSYKHA